MAESAAFDNDIATWCVHGGRLAAAETAWPEAPRPWIDLSTGINPRCYDAARTGPVDWRHLPDESAIVALEAAAAHHFGIDAGHVCAVPGSELALRLLGASDLPGPLRHVWPGYVTHASVTHGSAIAAEDIEAEARRGGTILLANPNNPDGRLWPIETLVKIAAALAERDGLLVIDEAFADFDAVIGLLPALPPVLRPHVVVLRSFGKFFGLAGLRLGFACAAPERLAPLRERLGSWPVSAGAVTIGRAAYFDQEWITTTRSRLREDAARLDALLLQYGLVARGECPLFRLVETPGARALFRRLAGQGILTRPFDYAPHWLRIGLPGDEAAWARLDDALRHG